MRRPLAAILLVLLLPALVLVNASTWALRTALDDAAFAATVTRVIDEPAVKDAIATRATTAIVETLDDAEGRLQVVAPVVLRLSGQPTRDQIEAALHARILTALDAPAVRSAMDQAIEAIHGFVIGAATSGDGPVSVRGDQLVLDLGPVVERVAAAIDERLPRAGLAEVPAGRATIVLAEADRFQTVSDTVDLLETLRILLPVLVIVVIVAILALAHRRARALGAIGVAMMIAGAVSIVVAWAGSGVAAGMPADPTAGRIAGDTYDAFVEVLIIQSLLLVAVGLFIVLMSWILQQRNVVDRSPSAMTPPTSR